MNMITGRGLVVAFVSAMAQITLCSEADSNAVFLVKTQLQGCVAALPNGVRGTSSYMMKFGMPDAMWSAETSLGQIVSNNIDVAYSNFSGIAESKIERMLFLASAWRLGDDYYLDCLSRNVDLAAAGMIFPDELRWYMKGHRTRRLTYMLAAQYDRPGVSNIVYRLIAYTGETNKYEKILSGEAKTEYLEFEQFMADGPEAPRQVE